MIQLSANGENFDLYPDTSVELEFNSPAFASADESGSFGYPFDLPGTTTNHRLTGHAYLLEKRDVTNISIPGTLSVGGLPLPTGTIKLTYPVSRERIRVYLVITAFADSIKNKTLKDVTYGDEVLMADLSAVETHMGSVTVPQTAEYAFFPSLVSVTAGFFQNDYFFNFRALSQGYLTATPHPYIYNIYKRMCETFGWNLVDEFFAIADDIRNLVLYHHRIIKQKVALPLNYYISMTEAVPDVSVSQFIRSLNSMFNTRLFIHTQRGEAKLTPLYKLLSNPWIEWTSKAEPGHEVTPTENAGYTLSFDWESADKLHDDYYQSQFKALVRYSPYYNWINERNFDMVEELYDVDMPASKDTYWINEAKAFYVYLSGVWQRLTWTDEGTVDDVFTVPGPRYNGVYYSTSDEQYYIYLANLPFSGTPPPEWVHFAYRKTDDLIVGEGETPLKATAHPPEMRLQSYYAHPYPTPGDLFMGAAGDFVRKDVDDDKTIRPLIYRGFDATLYSGYNYPLATSDIYDTRGVPVGTHSLRWDGDYGLYQKFWKLWLDFLGSTRKVTKNLRLTAADIFNLDLTQQVRIENINYLIGRLNVAINMRGISQAKAELYTVGSGTEAAMSSTSGEAPAGGIGVMEIESTNIVS